MIATKILCTLSFLTTASSSQERSYRDSNAFLGRPPRHQDPLSQAIHDLYSTLTYAELLANPADYPAHYSPADAEEFDFIVVGAGSAGSVVANRLSEEAWRVLLLEAGGNPTKTSEVPAFCQNLQKTELDWQFTTDAREPNCLGCKGRRCNWPRGKALGGSSTINYMLYMRGNKRDYDEWEAEGCTGWGYRDVLGYFKKSEDMRARDVLMIPDSEIYHSIGGNLKVESYDSEDEIFIRSIVAGGMKQLGYGINIDPNGKFQSGFNFMQGTIEDGKRCSTAKAFLSPITHRKNLKVSKYSLVTKILIEHRKAYGVEFINRDGRLIRVFARKEVILSAGSINTPQLLMVSGIGPRNILEKLNINVVQDLPVGENLQDHAFSTGLVMTLNFLPESDETDAESLLKFLSGRFGRLSTIPSFVGFINTQNLPFDYPDIQLFFSPFAMNDTAPLRLYLENFNFREEIIRQYLDLNARSPILLLQAGLLSPKSRGQVQINSGNPMQHPKIVTGYLSDRRDVDTFIEAFKFFHELVDTEAFRSVGARLHYIRIPTCDKLPFPSREFYDCFLRYIVTTTYHPCGTCKMGPVGSSDSVVDPRLRVKGVAGLRVVDASVMPKIPKGNTNAPTIMVGEKGSDLIKEDWLCRRATPWWHF